MSLQNTYTWTAALTDSDLPSTARHVALTLGVYMSSKGDSAWPGAVRLAHDTGLSERCVRQQLSLLVSTGWLVLVRRGGLRGETRVSNAYAAAIPGTTVTRDPASPVIVSAATPAGNSPDPGTTVTVPTHDLPKNKERGAAQAQPRTRGTRIPEPFEVTTNMLAWAAREVPHVDTHRETQMFVDHFLAAAGSKGVKVRWAAAWRNWMRRAAAGGFTR